MTMDQKQKKLWLNIMIGVILIAIALFFILRNTSEVDVETAQCIGANSILYYKTSCSACISQKEKFGDNFKYLNSINCGTESFRCSSIQQIPTWEIDGKILVGVQSIERLKELTGC